MASPEIDWLPVLFDARAAPVLSRAGTLTLSRLYEPDGIMHSTVGAIFAWAPGKLASPPPSCFCTKRLEGLPRTVCCRTSRLIYQGGQCPLMDRITGPTGTNSQAAADQP
jgi:hypothetical protein